MDISETFPLFDDIALSGRFSEALDHQTSVQIDQADGALFEDIHALAVFPEILDIADDRRSSVIGRDGVASSLDNPGASQATAEKECLALPNDRQTGIRRRTRNLPVSPWIRLALVIAKAVILSVRKAIGVVVKPCASGPGALHVSCRGPPAGLRRQSRQT